MDSTNLVDDNSQIAAGGEPPISDNSTPIPNPPLPSPQPSAAPLSSVSTNAPGYKFKYPEAAPTPPGADDIEWNKVFTAADSRLYNKHHKNATESKKCRVSGETRVLALKMLQEKIDKAAAAGSSSSSAPPKVKTPSGKKNQPPPGMMTEPSSSSRDGTPGAQKLPMSISEQIKSEGRARKAASAAPSSNRGTPAPPTSLAAPAVPNAMQSSSAVPPKSEKRGRKKKGTAAPVKRQAKRAKIENKVSTSSSSRNTSQTPGPIPVSSSEDESNDGGEYCICRGPDDHRMMVYCEGGCDDWYHCSCVAINEEDAKELLDRFFCPKCKTATNSTTWKRMCRYFNISGCRKAARVTHDPPSKYCSDEHRDAFFAGVRTKVRDDKTPSLGGALNRGEVGAILKEVKTIEELRALGSKPRLPKKEGADPDRPAGLDYLTPEEQKAIDDIKIKKQVIERRILGFQNQQKLLIMIDKRAKLAASHPDIEVKDPCGYDNRLAMNEDEFFSWSKTTEGAISLGSGVLGPRTDETKSIGTAILYPNQVVPETPRVPDALHNICLKARKKCKHMGWREIHNEEYLFGQKNLRDELQKLNKKEAEIIDDAETREATKDYDAENTVEVLF